MMTIGSAEAKRRKKSSLKKACKVEISKYCKSSKGKAIGRCLAKKAKKRSKKCKTALKRYKKRRRAKLRAKRAKITKQPVAARSKLRSSIKPVRGRIVANSINSKPIAITKPVMKPVTKPAIPTEKSLPLNEMVLSNASKIPVRPYCWKGLKQYKDKCPNGKGIRTTGLSKSITLKSKDRSWSVAKDSYGNSYCSGITYEAVAPVIIAKRWLETKNHTDVVTFQQLWYVVCPEGIKKSSGLHCKHPDGSVYALSKIKREAAVLAIEHAKIGHKVDYKKARSGDVVQLYRSGWGHSVLFKSWIQSDGSTSSTFDSNTAGLKYFSSQPATNGVGDHVECFKTSTCPKACGSCNLTDQAIVVGRLTGP
jgi:hypothetical protein